LLELACCQSRLEGSRHLASVPQLVRVQTSRRHFGAVAPVIRAGPDFTQWPGTTPSTAARVLPEPSARARVSHVRLGSDRERVAQRGLPKQRQCLVKTQVLQVAHPRPERSLPRERRHRVQRRASVGPDRSRLLSWCGCRAADGRTGASIALSRLQIKLTTVTERSRPSRMSVARRRNRIQATPQYEHAREQSPCSY
jgi:hypothetical protein